MVENSEFKKMVVRILRAYGRRVASADESDLADLAEVMNIAKTVLAGAALQQAESRSWAHVGAALGISREAAFKRFRQKEGVKG